MKFYSLYEFFFTEIDNYAKYAPSGKQISSLDVTRSPNTVSAPWYLSPQIIWNKLIKINKKQNEQKSTVDIFVCLSKKQRLGNHTASLTEAVQASSLLMYISMYFYIFRCMNFVLSFGFTAKFSVMYIKQSCCGNQREIDFFVKQL